MITKPEGYDESQAFTGEYETLEPGGYVCKIIKAEAVTAKSGANMLTVSLDITEGESKGFYARQQKSPDDKWRGIFNQLTDGKSTGFFKGMITSIEESNPGYKWNWDESTLKGKLFGGIFGREEFVKADGTHAMSVKCISVRSIKAVRDGIEPPKDKLLPASASGSLPPLSSSATAKWETVSSDSDLPF